MKLLQTNCSNVRKKKSFFTRREEKEMYCCFCSRSFDVMKVRRHYEVTDSLQQQKTSWNLRLGEFKPPTGEVWLVFVGFLWRWVAKIEKEMSKIWRNVVEISETCLCGSDVRKRFLSGLKKSVKRRLNSEQPLNETNCRGRVSSWRGKRKGSIVVSTLVVVMLWERGVDMRSHRSQISLEQQMTSWNLRLRGRKT